MVNKILSDLWASRPYYFLLCLIVFLHFRTELKIDERFREFEEKINQRFLMIELTLKDIQAELKIHDYKPGAHEKRLDKLEQK